MTRNCIRAETDDGTLLYNTLTGEMILAENGELSLSSPLTREQLIEKRFLVPEDLDENSLAETVRQIVSTLRARDAHITGYTILTTTDCNARCFYCYEAGVRKLQMSPETAEKTAEHIIASCGNEKVNINWFGGEPLLGKEVITLICYRLSEAGVRFKSRITSNGFLFDRETAFEAAEKWHLEKAQITLDGTREVYNRAKNYVNGGPDPFGRVMGNIGHLLEAGITVQARLNLNRDNFGDLMSLADLLGGKFGGNANFFAYPVPLRTFENDAGEFEDWRDEIKAYRALKDKLSSLGAGRPDVLRPDFSSVRCMADNATCEVIHPDGKVAKCEHFDETLVIGDVFSPGRDNTLIGKWKERVFFENCGQCPMRPMCINLKLCPWSRFGCTESIRILRIRNMQDKMRNYYLNTKTGLGTPQEL